MSAQSDDDLKSLLDALQAQDWNDRQQALKRVGPEQLKDERVQAAVKAVAEHDPNPTLQTLARALLGGEAVPTAAEAPPAAAPPSPVYSTGGFWIGFFGFFVVNGLLFCGATSGPTLYYSLGQFANLLPYILLLLNIAAPIILGFTGRKNEAVGSLAAWAAALALVVCAGIFLAVACSTGGLRNL